VIDRTERTYWMPTAGGAGVEVTLSGGLDNATWTCRGCGDTYAQFSALDLLASAGTHAAMCGRGATAVKLEKALADMRGELARVDSKAATLLTVAGVALSVGLAVLGRSHLAVVAAATGWLAVALLGAGVVLLALAIRPNLGGDHGLGRYAKAANGDQLLADLARERRTYHRPLADLAEQLCWTARAARAKYLRVRHAVTLLLAGLAAIAVTALLALGLA
jgi:hypothetical protein